MKGSIGQSSRLVMAEVSNRPTEIMAVMSAPFSPPAQHRTGQNRAQKKSPRKAAADAESRGGSVRAPNQSERAHTHTHKKQHTHKKHATLAKTKFGEEDA